jgi:hypothetical protein
MRSKIFIVALCLSLPFLACVPNIAGGSTETTNPAVVGTLYQPDGHTPAAGVAVHIRPKKTLADTAGLALAKKLAVLAATDSVVTDSAGQYAFDTTLDTGTYVIEAASGNNAALIDSVAVKTKTTTDTLAPDTLKPAGALKGVIKLSEGGDPRKVFVLAFGIDRFARVNADGSFKFSGLAEAKYDLRLISSLDNYGVLDTNAIPVISADTTNLDTISLPFTGIPMPKNVRISYDTLKQIVTVTWSRADTALVKSYNVYRRNVDSNTVAVRINVSPVADTVYRDSTGVQDVTYEYQIAAVNTKNTEGVKSDSTSQKIISAFPLLDTIVTPMINSSQTRSFIIGKDSTIYITTAGSSNFIRVLSKTGDSIGAIGEGLFSQVFDVALDSKDNVFAVDPDNNMIFKFLKNGQLVSSWPVSIPISITVDSLNNIYIVFSNGLGILKLDAVGQHIDSISLGSGTDEVHLAVAPDGKIFVGRLAINSITVYDANLSARGSFQLIAENNPLTELEGIDKNGNLYMRYVRSVQPDLEFRVFNSSGSYIAKLQPQRGGDFARVMGNKLYLMSQSGLSIYSIPF